MGGVEFNEPNAPPRTYTCRTKDKKKHSELGLTRSALKTPVGNTVVNQKRMLKKTVIIV